MASLLLVDIAMKWSARAALRFTLLSPLALFGCGTAHQPEDAEARALEIRAIDSELISQHGSSPQTEIIAELVVEGERILAEDVSWEVTRPAIGYMEDSTFRASGKSAGTTEITARLGDLAASTTISVVIEDVSFADFPEADVNRFARDPELESAEAVDLLYPLDGAVIPQNLRAPHVQWEGGFSGDAFRVTASAGLARAQHYESAQAEEYDFAWLPPQETWTRLVESAEEGVIRITVDRLEAETGKTHRSSVVTVEVAQAQLRGAIYYSDLSAGRIQRIIDGEREPILPNPMPKEETGERCVSCHSVSPDGNLLAVQMWGGSVGSAIYDLNTDLSIDDPPTAVPANRYRAASTAFSPDSKRLVISDGWAMSMVSVDSGELLSEQSALLPKEGAAHVAWSPDGRQIAFASGVEWQGPFFEDSDLSILDVHDDGTFSEPGVLHESQGETHSRPSFSPDSKWIAYARGETSIARTAMTDDGLPRNFEAALHLTSSDGVTSFDLSRATGESNNSYHPSFSPFAEGGYFWMVFFSTRDYGNAVVGTKGSGRRQLWITAIKENPEPGEDPSSVAFWIPHQDPATENLSAVWALEPPGVD